MENKPGKLNIRGLCQMGVFTALTAVCAQIAIPLPGGVPFTLQSWAIALAGLMLGPKNGAMSALAYVLLGLAGAPVFAQLTGGLGVLLRPTGGFILSFPFMAFLSGLGARKPGLGWAYAGLGAGTLLNWALGMLYFSWQTNAGLYAAFTAAVAPFLLVGLARTALLPLVSKSLKAALAKGGLAL